ncbi:MAG: conserved hypothetical protein [Methanobrevibacter sp. CfCl-M3]
MKSEIVLRAEAMDILSSKLGIVDAERFIDFIKKEEFDYTEWQRDLWKGKSIKEINKMAIEYQKEKRKNFD